MGNWGRCHILALLFFFLGSSFAFAEPLEHYYGWTLNKISRDSLDPDGSYNLRPDFFSLVPPDQRAPITVDFSTASALRRGEKDPESLYGSQNQTQASNQSAEEYVYGSTNKGFVAPDVIPSTLPLEIRGGAEPLPLVKRDEPRPRRSESRVPIAFPVAALGSVSSPLNLSGAASLPQDPGSAAGKRPPLAAADSSPQGATTSPPVRPMVPEKTEADLTFNSRQSEAAARGLAVSAGAQADTKEVAKPTGFGGFDSFGAGPKKTKKEAEKIPFKAASPASGDPAKGSSSGAAPGPCVDLKKVVDQAGTSRLNLPVGCDSVRFFVWGPGGGENGGGGGFVSGEGKVDTKQYDLVLVVGAAGSKEHSGVFLIEKGGVSKTIHTNKALAVAAGGGKMGSNGSPGQAGGAPATSLEEAFESGKSKVAFTNPVLESGKGAQPGGMAVSGRGSAGESQSDGKVIVEVFKEPEPEVSPSESSGAGSN